MEKCLCSGRASWRDLLVGARPRVRLEKTGFGRAKKKEKRTNGACVRNMVSCACVYVYLEGSLRRRPESS